MNEKILMNIFLPQIDREIEVWVPVHLCFGVLNSLLGQVATAVTNGQFIVSEELLLCEASTGRPYALSKTPAMLGLLNGATAMLI